MIVEKIVSEITQADDGIFWIFADKVDTLISDLRRNRALLIYADDKSHRCLEENYRTLPGCTPFNFIAYICSFEPYTDQDNAIGDVMASANVESRKVVIVTSNTQFFQRWEGAYSTMKTFDLTTGISS